MSSIPTKVPQIPAIPKGIDPETRRYLEAIKQVIEVREGTRGKHLDQSVTFRDLIDVDVDISALHIPGTPSQIGGDSGGSGTTTGSGGTVLPELSVPLAPTGFRAVGGFEVVFLEWDNPREVFSNYGLTQIFRCSESNLSKAVMIGTSSGTNYFDRVEPNTSYYYWIRHMTSGTPPVPGPFVGPEYAASALDPEIVLETLSGKISESELATSLGERIDFIDTVNEKVNTVVAGTQSNYLAIQESMEAVSALEGRYTLRIDANGYVAGFGLSVEPDPTNPDTETSFFIIRADNFAIVPPSMAAYADQAPVYPFVVGQVTMPDGSKKWMVAMDGATIIDASIKKAAIDEAQIGNTHIDEEGISSNHLTSGTIRADQSIEVGNSHFILETLDASGRLRIIDTNGINRVIMGLTGLDRYGLIINDSEGDAVLDADGNIVKISKAAIENLKVGGYKITVPDSSYIAGALSIPVIPKFLAPNYDIYCFDNKTPILINSINYDPQGCEHLSVDISFGFIGYGTWSSDGLRGTSALTPAYSAFKLEVKCSDSYGDYSGELLWTNLFALLYENDIYYSPMNPYYPDIVTKMDNFAANFLTTKVDPSKRSYITVFLTPYCLTANLTVTELMANMKDGGSHSPWAYVWSRNITLLGTR